LKLSEFLPLFEALAKENHVLDLIKTADLDTSSMNQISELALVRDLSSKYQELVKKNIVATSGASWDLAKLKFEQIQGVLQVSATALRVIAAFDPYTWGQKMNVAVYDTVDKSENILQDLFWELHKETLTPAKAQEYFEQVSNVVRRSDIEYVIGNWFFYGTAQLAFLAIVPYQGGHQLAQSLATELVDIVAQLQHQ